MKNFKRLTAALSAVTLAATMSISAFAAETTPSISDDKATLNIGTGITTVNGAQTTMMAYVVPGIIGADDTVPAFDATSHTIVALDQVDGETGIASVPVDANKLADGNSIVVKISGTTGELATYVITMEAQVTTYSVTYELDGGSVTGTNPGTFGTEDTIAAFIGALTAPAKVDVTGTYTYTFKGWATSATATTTIDTTSTALMTTLLAEGSTTLTLYAIYEEHSATTPAGATVTFMNGTETFATATAVDGKVALPATNPTLEAVEGYATTKYEFVGWVTADGTEFTATTTVEENTTVYPKFSSNLVYGDVDGDGVADGIDVYYLNTYDQTGEREDDTLAGLSISHLLENAVCGDVDGDGVADGIDVYYLNTYDQTGEREDDTLAGLCIYVINK